MEGEGDWGLRGTKLTIPGQGDMTTEQRRPFKEIVWQKDPHTHRHKHTQTPHIGITNKLAKEPIMTLLKWSLIFRINSRYRKKGCNMSKNVLIS